MLFRLLDWLDGIPEWLRPPIIGALVLASMVALRVLLLIPRAIAAPATAWGLALDILAAGAGGAFAGLVYSLAGSRVRRVPIVGPYLTGILVVASYLLAMIVVVPVVLPGLASQYREMFDLRNHVAQAIWSGLSLFYGLIVGQFWFRRHTQ